MHKLYPYVSRVHRFFLYPVPIHFCIHAVYIIFIYPREGINFSHIEQTCKKSLCNLCGVNSKCAKKC